MSYNPHRYKHLFKKGLFDYPDAELPDFAASHRLFALNMHRDKIDEINLMDGFTIKTGHINQGKGFSNYLISEIDPKKRNISLCFSHKKLAYPIDLYKKLKSPLFITNMGYFYLTDDEKKDPVPPPHIRVGNLVIDKDKLLNLPILNRGAFIIYKNGDLDISFLEARGRLKIGREDFLWVGSKVDKKRANEIVVYNSSNLRIAIVNDPIMGPSRVVEKVFVSPPKDKNLVICKMIRDTMIVSRVTKDKILMNDKIMVLEIDQKYDLKNGQKIQVETIDTLKVEEVRFAVSVGPILFKDKLKTEKQVELEKFGQDMANPNNPHESAKKLARGALLKLKDGKFVSVLIDAIPQAGEIYPGVTLSELVDFINEKYPDFESGICTDPSSTLKGIYKNRGKTVVFGNPHYLDHKRNADGEVEFWPTGEKGRKVNSVLVVN